MDAELQGLQRIAERVPRLLPLQQGRCPRREPMRIHQVGVGVHPETLGFAADFGFTNEVGTQPVAEGFAVHQDDFLAEDLIRRASGLAD